MQRRTASPADKPPEPKPGTTSGDVKVDEGERVYVSQGDVIAGKYCVDRILGVGGVGFVVAARHTELGGTFALKFLKKRFLADKAIVERFTREARAACRIQSDYVARVFDVGSHGRAPFLVMEHLVGRDLSTVLAERGPFPIGDALEYTVQACAALAAAHASGVVHRDIKPENLFLVNEDGPAAVKLLDFGISKVGLASERPSDEWGPEGEPITGTLICGTPAYMSPEQIRSTATVDARSDIWSLGMVLYELLTGTTAFQGETLPDLCSAIVEQTARRVTELRPELPDGLADAIDHCLRKDPADRYANIAEFAVALLPFAGPRALAIAEGSPWIRREAIRAVGSLAAGEARISGSFAAPISSNTLRSASQPMVDPGRTTNPATEKTRRTTPSLRVQSSSTRRVAIIGAVVLAGAALATVAAMRLHRSAPATASAPARAAVAPAPVAPHPAAHESLPAPDDRVTAPTAVRVVSTGNSPPVASPPPPAPPPPRPSQRSRASSARAPSANASSQSSAPASSPAEPPPAPVPVAPPVAPGRPDLGY